jgi:hypothetical protein
LVQAMEVLLGRCRHLLEALRFRSVAKLMHALFGREQRTQWKSRLILERSSKELRVLALL